MIEADTADLRDVLTEVEIAILKTQISGRLTR